MFRVLFAPIIRNTTAAYSHSFCMVWCVIPWSEYWFGTLLHLRTVSYSVKVTQNSTCSNGITYQTIQNLWLYAAVVLLMMGANSTIKHAEITMKEIKNVVYI
jgi:hypothetical protein